MANERASPTSPGRQWFRTPLLFALLVAVMVSRCVQIQSGPAVGMRVLLPSQADGGTAIVPGQTLTVAVQALNSSDAGVNGVPIVFVAQDRIALVDAPGASTVTVTTGPDSTTGADGVALTHVQMAPGATFGPGQVLAFLALWDNVSDASDSHAQAASVTIPLNVVAGTGDLQLVPFPTALTLTRDLPVRLFSVQVVTDGGTSVDGQQIFAEIDPPDAGVMVQAADAGSPSASAHAVTQARSAEGLTLDGVAQFTVSGVFCPVGVQPDAGGPIDAGSACAATNTVTLRYGFVNAAGNGTGSGLGSISVTVAQ